MPTTESKNVDKEKLRKYLESIGYNMTDEKFEDVAISPVQTMKMLVVTSKNAEPNSKNAVRSVSAIMAIASYALRSEKIKIDFDTANYYYSVMPDTVASIIRTARALLKPEHRDDLTFMSALRDALDIEVIVKATNVLMKADDPVVE